MGLYKKHKAKWSDCTECPLSEVRKNIVLARGELPSDILFIGEAPGPAEDVLGRPFIGPAGHLLDSQIEYALKEAASRAGEEEISLRLAFTNLIACIPTVEPGKKFGEPPKTSILACQQRLREFIKIAKPKAIVRVGQHSKKWITEAFLKPLRTPCVDIIHPAAILRADISQKGLANQKVIVSLRDLFVTIHTTECEV